MYRSKNGPDHCAGHRHLGQLEGNGVGVTDDAGTDFDQFELQVGQRPLGHFFGQFDTVEEGRQVIG